MPGNKKATENIGFQIARLANHLRSATNWFENCPAMAAEHTVRFLALASRGLFHFVAALPYLLRLR
jgi:hypothetical protein